MRFKMALILLFTASSLGACGGGPDDVEVVLPFVGNVMGKAKGKEEKMATRGTLVLPPSVKGLPEPSSQQAAGNASWPVDPDEKAKGDARIAAAKKEKIRKEGDWKGENNGGNGLEDFKKKVDWQKRQTGIFQPQLKQE